MKADLQKSLVVQVSALRQRQVSRRFGTFESDKSIGRKPARADLLHCGVPHVSFPCLQSSDGGQDASEKTWPHQRN
jgi:hypothetical protein